MPRTRAAPPVLKVLLTLGVAAALLFGLSWAGDEARRRLGPRDRYAVRFSAIQCDSPPGTSRETFLIEVRYAANAPQTVQSVDPTLSRQLTAAFSAHPWVANVDGVSVEPPDVVSVRLTFRKPVLAIRTAEGRRAVDAKGILLPATAPSDGLPELLSPVAAPGKAGQPWPDADVLRAASVVAEYHPKSIERTEQGWQIVQPDGRKLVVAR